MARGPFFGLLPLVRSRSGSDIRHHVQNTTATGLRSKKRSTFRRSEPTVY